MHDPWRSFIARVGALGDLVVDDPGGVDASGVRHLAGQVSGWLEWALASGDGARPRLVRGNEPFDQWGGPNADNVYKYARLDPSATYRLRGSMGCCEELLLAARVDNMHMPERGTKGELRLRDLGLVEGDDVDVAIGPAGSGADLELDPAVRMLAIREYYIDWRPLPPATLVLERVSGPVPPDARSVADALDEAAAQIERSMRFWDDYMVRARADGTANAFAPSRREGVGLAGMTYGFCFYALRDDEALLVDVEPPDAGYWSLQLYTLRWFEALDLSRLTSLNHHQAERSDDGHVAVVVSTHDTGAANRLDTCGVREGLLTFRTAWPRGDVVDPTARVVPVDALPASIRLVGTDERAAQLTARELHHRWRWRA